MLPKSPTSPAYKEMTLQQLRSLCETVRLGSFSAAAVSLGLSHPTIWDQVRALERRFGVALVETHSRGCRPTKEGLVLAELAAPLVAGINSLDEAFREARSRMVSTLTVAATPRIVAEDLPGCVLEFERRLPQIQLTLKELRTEEVIAAVRSGDAELGLAPSSTPRPGDAWLQFEPHYELDVILVTPRDHPLARRRVVRPKDLCAYPLVNAPSSFVDPTVMLILEKFGGPPASQRRVETFTASTICRYVKLGFGIGLIGRVPSSPPIPGLYQRSMSAHFGRTIVYLISRKGAIHPPPVREFADTVKAMLTRAEVP